MMQIQSENDAKEFFLRFNDDRRAMYDCSSEAELDAYLHYATEENERKWQKEEFFEHYQMIFSGHHHNMYHFQKMMSLYLGCWWESLYRVGQILWSCPLNENNAGKIFLELMKVADSDYPYTEEQRIAMFTLADSFIEKFHLHGKYVWYQRWYRMRILGVKSFAEAEEFFRKEYGFPHFRTELAKESYDKWITPKKREALCQDYFEDILRNGNDDVKDHQTIFRLFLEYDMAMQSNVQQLYNYLYFYAERIRRCFWCDVAQWIVLKLTPILYEKNFVNQARDFLILVNQLVWEDAALDDIPFYRKDIKEQTIAQLKLYNEKEQIKPAVS